MNAETSTLLITGSGARFATHISEQLTTHGWSVRTLLQSDPTLVPEAHGGHVEEPDTDTTALLDALDGADAVILLGGIGSMNAVVADAAALDTVLGNLRPGATLISITSLAVFGNSGSAPVTESDPPQTPDEFATARVCEQRVLAADDWLRSAVLRPGLVYGNDAGGLVLHDAVDLARTHGVAHYFGEPADIIPTVHEDDLVDLVLRVLDSTASGIFHAASGAVSTQGLAELVAAAAGVDKIAAWDEDSMVKTFGRRVSVPRVSINSDLARSRSATELAWAPAGATLRACLDL